MEEEDSKSNSPKETKKNKRFKWFYNFSRSEKNLSHYKENNKLSDNSINNIISLSRSASSTDLSGCEKKSSQQKNNNVFYTLRKRVQKKLTSGPKVKAIEGSVVSPLQIQSLGEGSNVISSNSLSSSPRPELLPSNSSRFFIENENATSRSSPTDLETPVVVAVSSFPPPIAEIPPTDAAADEQMDVVEDQSFEDPNGSNVCIYVNVDVLRDQVMISARLELSKYGWYWGSLSRNAAQRRLAGQTNGSFLVRDSETDKHQFTLSFRSSACTLHNRISYFNGHWHIESSRYESIVALFEDTMRKSEEGVFCYVKRSNHILPPFPVRLINPINRFYEVSPLQHLCRFVIRQKIAVNNVTQLPLPAKLKEYVQENFYENV